MVNPNKNPSDGYFAQQFNSPGFTSAAAAGGSHITFFPAAKDHQQDVDSTMVHEGETTSPDSSGGSGQEAGVGGRDQEGQLVALGLCEEHPWGKVSPNLLVMYSASKKTPCEKTARRLYPNRYAELDKITGAEAAAPDP